jgi:hypothetical protein
MANTRVTNPVTDFDKSNTTQGLKLPSGTNSNQPIGVDAIQGMLRNDTEETVDSSASALTHYNGTNWRYFAATESPGQLVGNPLTFVSASDVDSYPSPQTGNTWFDISGEPSYDATKSGSVSWSAGSFDFGNSTSNYFQWPNTGPFATPSNILAISSWFKLDTTTSKAYPFSISQSNSTNTYGIIQIRPDAGVIGVGFRNGSSAVEAQNSFLWTGTTNWTHLVTQYKNNSVELYINGTKINIDSSGSSYAGGFSSSSWFSDLSTLTSPTAQTGRLRNVSPVATDGKISKVGIYPAALTQSQIDVLVAEGSGA